MRFVTILMMVLVVSVGAPVSAEEMFVRKLSLSAPGGMVHDLGNRVVVRSQMGMMFEITGEGKVIERTSQAILHSTEPLPFPLVGDGRVARSSDGRVEAWYSGETQSYGHGALGDTVEALTLVVREDGGRPAVYTAIGEEVFEDLEPRIVDLDREQSGRPEVVAITASPAGGAGIAIFGIGRDRDGNPALIRLANSARIGTPYRWLNIAGIDDFDGDGFTEIAYVDRPHVLGELVFLEWRGGRLREQVRDSGYANHHGGSTIQDLSETADVDGDGNPDLILPVRGYESIAAVSLTTDGPRRIAEATIPSAPRSSIVSTSPLSAVYLDADGILFEIRWGP